MHIDARELDNDTLITGDICIIGAGVAGISIALEFLNTAFKVILLEGGGFEYDDKVQKLYDGNITGQTYYPTMSSRLHYFGGTSGHWGGLCTHLDEFDFKEKSWIKDSGWPISLEDLSPFYKRAHPILDLNYDEFSIEYLQKENPSLIEFPFQKNVLYDKIWQRSLPTRFGAKYRNQIINSKNIFLYTYANATELTTSSNISTLKEITVKNYTNKTHKVRAKYFILACNAIQNPRILLASNKQVSVGLGNSNDIVGRYFMEHPEINSGELWLNNANPLLLYQWSPKTRAEIAVSKQKQEELKISNGMVALSPLQIQKNKVPNVVSWKEKDPRLSKETFHKYASKAIRRNIFDKTFSANNFKAYGIYSRTEQAPNQSSRVTLNNELDTLGMPRIDLKWLLSPIDKRTIREITKLLGQQIGLTNLGRVKIYDFLLDENDHSLPDYTSGGWHHLGTTRMSNNPKEGVVDANCKVHGINNLFIAGSSCFPTGGAATPTLTVVALSLRLSDHLKKYFLQ